MRESRPGAAAMAVPGAVRVVLFLAAAGTLYFGLFPNRVMAFVSNPALLSR